MGYEELKNIEAYQFHTNDPFDLSRDIQLVVPQIMSSQEYMRSIRSFSVPEGALAVWFLGQKGFLLKDSISPLIAIDLYLTNSCAQLPNDLNYRLDRQLPIFIEPEDLDVDIFLTTHSHQDHADPETISRVPKTGHTVFAGPFNAIKVFEECGVPQQALRMLHPGQTFDLGTATVQATFALPTDTTDLNHTGLLVTFSNGITFYNTGDTACQTGYPCFFRKRRRSRQLLHLYGNGPGHLLHRIHHYDGRWIYGTVRRTHGNNAGSTLSWSQSN